MERNLYKVFAGLLICAMVFSFAPASRVLAAGNWYVRVDGSDTSTVCDGTVDKAYNDPTLQGTGCAFATISHALTMAAAGDTIHVGPGTFTLPVTVIDKSLTLEGSGRDNTFLNAEANAGTDGWIHVNPGVIFNMSGFTVDGTGHDIVRGVNSFGTGAIQNNSFLNIAAPGYQGIAVSSYNSSTISNNQFNNIGRVGILISTDTGTEGTNTATVANNVYTGKGEGDQLDYGIEIGAGAHATVTGNVITNNKGVVNQDDHSAGIYVDTFFGSGTNVTITSNSLTKNYAGIAVGYDTADTSTVTASFNEIYGNKPSGLLVMGTNASVTAENNWWGCNLGPGNVTCDSVSGTADFTPYLVLTAGPAFSTAPLAVNLFTANLKMNSAGEDTSTAGVVSNDVRASFMTYKDNVEGQGGTVNPTKGNAVSGVFTTSYIAPVAPIGTKFQVCAGVDEQAVCSDVTIDKMLIFLPLIFK